MSVPVPRLWPVALGARHSELLVPERQNEKLRVSWTTLEWVEASLDVVRGSPSINQKFSYRSSYLILSLCPTNKLLSLPSKRNSLLTYSWAGQGSILMLNLHLSGQICHFSNQLSCFISYYAKHGLITVVWCRGITSGFDSFKLLITRVRSPVPPFFFSVLLKYRKVGSVLNHRE